MQLGFRGIRCFCLLWRGAGEAIVAGHAGGCGVHGRLTSSACFCTMLDITCDEMLNLERSTAVGMRPRTAARTVQKAVQICENTQVDR